MSNVHSYKPSHAMPSPRESLFSMLGESKIIVSSLYVIFMHLSIILHDMKTA